MAMIPEDLMSRLRFLAEGKNPIIMVPTSDGDVQRPALEVAVECIDGLEARVAELEQELRSEYESADDMSNEVAAIQIQLDRAQARVEELEAELDSWPLHGEGRLTKAGWSLAQDRYRHVCETVAEFRGYWTELQGSQARVKELEAALMPMNAGTAPTFSIYRITDSGFSDAKYLVRVDGRHLPVFHIRDDVWGMWMHQGPRQCEYPDASIEILVVDARGCSMPKGALGIVATDQPGEGG